ncbi:hypothetical protein Ddc_10597 [Ditylenchus destructor]|nr:hypothetical protein Ddc_10597 [Ditylenchus destructor]
MGSKRSLVFYCSRKWNWKAANGALNKVNNSHSYGQQLSCFDSLIDCETEGSRCTLRKQFLTLSNKKTKLFTANPARRMSAVFVAVIVGSQQFVGWFFASSPEHIAPSLHFPRPRLSSQ